MIQINLFDTSPIQTISHHFKRDMPAWKGLGCPQYMQRPWWQINVTLHTGLLYYPDHGAYILIANWMSGTDYTVHICMTICHKFNTFVSITAQENSFIKKNKNNTKHTCINNYHKTQLRSEHAVWCRYNAVIFLTKIHKRHPIARPSGRDMGCILWIQHLIDILPRFL